MSTYLPHRRNQFIFIIITQVIKFVHQKTIINKPMNFKFWLNNINLIYDFLMISEQYLLLNYNIVLMSPLKNMPRYYKHMQ